eukprot:TRINITY_DN29147_c0_g1_i1.p1 TRINITY_DN29147_c0_g1~~TRINITY_DN29147_c0_g1_i1.p1  ORF type:complete len:173 (+),score=34.41 TRINITY_DN29147_c0_g1_i1:196-714(+)
MSLTPFFGGRPRSRDWGLWDPWDSSISRDPWVPVSRLFESMDNFASSALASFSRDTQAIANTKVDWKETPDAHVFTADMPGLKKEEVRVELVDKGTLRISGERHREEVQETDTWHRMERSSGKFMRQFRLPEDVNEDQVSAKMENGVLVVNAPKFKKDNSVKENMKSVPISS